MSTAARQQGRALVAAVVIAAAFLTVAAQFAYIFDHYGRDYVVTQDRLRHVAKVKGVDIAPSRYRVLSDFALEGLLRVSPYESKQEYEVVAFLFRLAQNLAIFLLAQLYYRSLGLSRARSLAGLALLAYGLCTAFWQSDLSYYTYTALALLLAAGALVNRNEPETDWWLVPLTLVAALNREEAVFIPLMLFAARAGPPREWLGDRRLLIQVALCLAAFVAVYVGVRLWRGPAAYSHGRYGVGPGLENLLFNLGNPRTWIGLAQMYAILPLALLAWPRWPEVLRRYLLVLVVPWFAAQLVFGAADETRLFLGPMALIFVPAAVSLGYSGSLRPSSR